jgi:hypothetical protein
MSFFSSIVSKLSPKEKPPVVAKQWKTGMWVIWNTKPYILHKLGETCELHEVSAISGETVNIVSAPLDHLRQSTYEEIPAVRRNISKEAAKELGYGS